MTRRIVTIGLVGITCLATLSPARAAIYEFTLEGSVNHSGRADISPGDPFTIRYIADSNDMDPDLRRGQYAATEAVATLPNATIYSMGLGPVFVRLDDERDWVVRANAVHTDRFRLEFYFPPGTLELDALPLTLPLSEATNAFWYLQSLSGNVNGPITSYSSVLVPEPSRVSALLAYLVFLSRYGARRIEEI